MAGTMVAVDLGGAGIRAVQFKMHKGVPVLGKTGYISLPVGAFENGEIRDQSAVAATLKALWAQEKFSSKQVVFGVANAKVHARSLDVDWLPKDQFDKALKYMVSDHVPVDVEHANLAYHQLGEYDTTGPDGAQRRMARILLVAADTDTIDSFVATFKEAGLKPEKADLNPFALIRAVQPKAAAAGEVEVLVDMGAHVTNVAIHQGGQPRFVRTVTAQSGESLTNILMERFHWSHEDAERTKIALGASHATGASDTHHAAQPVIDQEVSAFVGEIRQSVAFFTQHATDIERITRVVLTGGTGNTLGLAERLGSELRVPVVHGAALDAAAGKAKVPEGTTQQQMAVAVGLAMGVAQ